MNFVLQKAWHVSFLESDSRTRLWRTLTFNDSAKIFEMATRGGAKFTSEDRSMFEYGMQNGRGAVWLNLTEDQYRRLK